jgi:hypothetical protein
VSSEQAAPVTGRRRLPPRALILFVLFAAVALFASRTCAESARPVTQDRAVQIARDQIPFTPDGFNVRFLRRGVSEHPYWAVSLWTRGAGGGYDRITVVLVDADSGQVTGINDEEGGSQSQ